MTSRSQERLLAALYRLEAAVVSAHECSSTVDSRKKEFQNSEPLRTQIPSSDHDSPTGKPVSVGQGSPHLYDKEFCICAAPKSASVARTPHRYGNEVHIRTARKSASVSQGSLYLCGNKALIRSVRSLHPCGKETGIRVTRSLHPCGK